MSTTLYDALADTTRRRILDLLRQGELPVNDLVAALGVAQPNVSKHLRALTEAGLVRARPEGRRRVYALRPEPLRELDVWLAPYRRFWAERLDALEARLDAMDDMKGSED
ncbi:ArsR/SmtB family transcription factor [Nocardioides iriomotensis]|uniref:Transcriptional regulator n=1 Tax=Nocardioides iriomotensis TaxID=715784 RepID=A0A4Q5J0J1_9ACTN|nr:metalloregulator ArsR/SmtB family transcription factor [Nocardioides iriomotensis]RYU10795.1 transcriptional regulator [Nocardioides iriomotensis]